MMLADPIGHVDIAGFCASLTVSTHKLGCNRCSCVLHIEAQQI